VNGTSSHVRIYGIVGRKMRSCGRYSGEGEVGRVGENNYKASVEK
jgi:hypothetical protein